MWGLVIAVVVALALVAGYLAIEMHLFRKYGFAELPDQIRRVDDRLGEAPVRLDLSGFAPHAERFGRRAYRRTIAAPDGVWTWTVEVDGDAVVAHRADFRHRESYLAGRRQERCCPAVDPKIVVPGE